jgi:hypothetical protein
MPQCAEAVPPAVAVAAGHHVACYLYGEATGEALPPR